MGSIAAQFVNSYLMELNVGLLLLVTGGTMLLGGILGVCLPSDAYVIEKLADNLHNFDSNIHVSSSTHVHYGKRNSPRDLGSTL